MANYKDDVATMIGAVNTLWYEGDKLCATNSDAYGFSANLDDFAPDWIGETAVIFGAGGAARAVLYSLKNVDLNVFAYSIVQRGVQKI